MFANKMLGHLSELLLLKTRLLAALGILVGLAQPLSHGYRCENGRSKAARLSCAQGAPAGSPSRSGLGSTRRHTKTSWSTWWIFWRWTPRNRWAWRGSLALGMSRTAPGASGSEGHDFRQGCWRVDKTKIPGHCHSSKPQLWKRLVITLSYSANWEFRGILWLSTVPQEDRDGEIMGGNETGGFLISQGLPKKQKETQSEVNWFFIFFKFKPECNTLLQYPRLRVGKPYIKCWECTQFSFFFFHTVLHTC